MQSALFLRLVVLNGTELYWIVLNADSYPPDDYNHEMNVHVQCTLVYTIVCVVYHDRIIVIRILSSEGEILIQGRMDQLQPQQNDA